MCKIILSAALASAAAFAALPAAAHGIAGNRLFPATLTIDDPAVGDELSAPTVTYQPNGSSREYDYGFEWDKRLTEDLGVAINDRYRVTRQPAGSGGNLYGWDDPVVTLKYQLFINAPHEMLASLGVQKEFGGAGAVNHGLADATGWTQPTLYLGKGMGDLPLGLMQPFALTGELGYQWADIANQTAADGTRSHNPDFWNVGVSLQYDLQYLRSQVRDYGLPEVFNHLTPLVEFSYNTPAGRSYGGATTTGTIAPGVLFNYGAFQFGIEALIPATHAAGNATGLIAQFHLYLDDLLPTTLGKPLFQEVRSCADALGC